MNTVRSTPLHNSFKSNPKNQVNKKQAIITEKINHGIRHYKEPSLLFLPFLVTLSQKKYKDISHEEAKKLLQLAGADHITEAHLGNCIDKALNTLISQLITLPIRASIQVAQTSGAELSNTHKAIARLGKDAGTIYARDTVNKARHNFGFFSRSVQHPRKHTRENQASSDEHEIFNSDKAPQEINICPISEEQLHAYQNQLFDIMELMANQVDCQSGDKIQGNKQLKEIQQELEEKIQNFLKKDKDFKKLMLLDERRAVLIASMIATTSIDIITSALGSAALAKIDLGLCAYLISTITRPITNSAIQAINNWYETKSIANTLIEKYKKLVCDTNGKQRKPSQEELQRLAYDVQDHFEPKELANFHRVYENVLEPTKAEMDLDLNQLIYQIEKKEQLVQAKSAEEYTLIEEKFKNLEKLNKVNNKLARTTQDLARDLAEVQLLTSYAQWVEKGIIDVGTLEQMIDKKSHALFSVMASQHPDAIKLSKNIQEIYAGIGYPYSLYDVSKEKVKLHLTEQQELLSKNNRSQVNPLQSLPLTLDHRDQYLDKLLSRHHKHIQLSETIKLLDQKIIGLRNKQINSTMDHSELLVESLTKLREKKVNLEQEIHKYEKDMQAYHAKNAEAISMDGKVAETIISGDRGILKSLKRSIYRPVSYINNKRKGLPTEPINLSDLFKLSKLAVDTVGVGLAIETGLNYGQSTEDKNIDLKRPRINTIDGETLTQHQLRPEKLFRNGIRTKNNPIEPSTTHRMVDSYSRNPENTPMFSSAENDDVIDDESDVDEPHNPVTRLKRSGPDTDKKNFESIKKLTGVDFSEKDIFTNGKFIAWLIFATPYQRKSISIQEWESIFQKSPNILDSIAKMGPSFMDLENALQARPFLCSKLSTAQVELLLTQSNILKNWTEKDKWAYFNEEQLQYFFKKNIPHMAPKMDYLGEANYIKAVVDDIQYTTNNGYRLVGIDHSIYDRLQKLGVKPLPEKNVTSDARIYPYQYTLENARLMQTDAIKLLENLKKNDRFYGLEHITPKMDYADEINHVKRVVSDVEHTTKNKYYEVGITKDTYDRLKKIGAEPLPQNNNGGTYPYKYTLQEAQAMQTNALEKLKHLKQNDPFYSLDKKYTDKKYIDGLVSYIRNESQSYEESGITEEQYTRLKNMGVTPLPRTNIYQNRFPYRYTLREILEVQAQKIKQIEDLEKETLSSKPFSHMKSMSQEDWKNLFSWQPNVAKKLLIGPDSLTQSQQEELSHMIWPALKAMKTLEISEMVEAINRMGFGGGFLSQLSDRELQDLIKFMPPEDLEKIDTQQWVGLLRMKRSWLFSEDITKLLPLNAIHQICLEGHFGCDHITTEQWKIILQWHPDLPKKLFGGEQPLPSPIKEEVYRKLHPALSDEQKIYFSALETKKVLGTILHPALNPHQYIDDYIAKKIKDYEQQKGKNTGLTKDSTIVVSGKILQNFGGMRRAQDAESEDYREWRFSLHDIISGEYARFIRNEIGRDTINMDRLTFSNKEVLDFIRTEDLQRKALEELDQYTNNPEIQQAFKIYTKTMLNTRINNMLDAYQNDSQITQALNGVLEGRLQAQSMRFSGKTLDSIVFIPSNTEGTEGVLFSLKDKTHFKITSKNMCGKNYPDIPNNENFRKWILSSLSLNDLARYKDNQSFHQYSITPQHTVSGGGAGGYGSKTYPESVSYVPFSFTQSSSIDNLSNHMFDGMIKKVQSDTDYIHYTHAEQDRDYYLTMTKKLFEVVGMAASMGTVGSVSKTVSALGNILDLSSASISIGQYFNADRPEKEDEYLKDAIVEGALAGIGTLGDGIGLNFKKGTFDNIEYFKKASPNDLKKQIWWSGLDNNTKIDTLARSYLNTPKAKRALQLGMDEGKIKKSVKDFLNKELAKDPKTLMKHDSSFQKIADYETPIYTSSGLIHGSPDSVPKLSSAPPSKINFDRPRVGSDPGPSSTTANVWGNPAARARINSAPTPEQLGRIRQQENEAARLNPPLTTREPLIIINIQRIQPAELHHIFHGDTSGGGHLYLASTANNGKSKFPREWDRNRIRDTILTIANNKDITYIKQADGRLIKQQAIVDGHRQVNIKVIISEDGKTIISVYPTRDWS
jgi:hypothetical protein